MLTLAATTSALAADAAVTCESGKNGTLGRYASCMFKAQGTFVKGGSTDTAGYSEAVAKCEKSYGSKWQSTEMRAAGMCPSNSDQAGIQDFMDACLASAQDALGGGTLPLDVQTCNSDLAAGGAGPRGEVPKTGQAACYDVGGSVIACSGTGQDGEFRMGRARSFTDNGDGTITDNNTGLMWEKLDDSNLPGLAGIHDRENTYTWANAFVKVADLNGVAFAGHTDWRVPNVAELQTLVNFGAIYPAVDGSFNTGCVPGCTVTTCSCTRPYGCWSSTTYEQTPHNAWGVYFNVGWPFADSKTFNLGVRAVRAGS